MFKFIKVVSANLLIFSLSACVGATFFVKTQTIESKIADSYNSCPGKNGKITTCTTEGIKVYTPQKLLHDWGKPESYKAGNGMEYFTYNAEYLTWRGAVIHLIIPIPLLVPVGHNEITFIFNDGKLSGSTYEIAKRDNFVCGMRIFGSNNPTLFGCNKQGLGY